MWLKLPNFVNRFDVRLSLFYSITIVLLSIGISFYYYFHLRNNLMMFVDKVISDETAELLQEIQESINDGGTIINGCRLFMEDTSEREHYPIFFRILINDNSPLFESDNFQIINLPQMKNKEQWLLLPIKNRNHLRLHVTPVRINNLLPEYTIQIGTITEHADEILTKVIQNAFVISPIILLLSILGSILVSRQSGKIIKQITETTRTISSKNLSERLPAPDTYNEIREMVFACNTMLDRLENDFILTRQFSSDVSHELRTPLFAIRGMMEVALSKKRSEDEYRETLLCCVERTDRMVKMVNDLFLITRYDAKKISMDLQPLILNDLIIEIHEFYTPIAQGKEIDFSLNLELEIKTSLDKIKILQLMNNLIDNAIYFTPSQGSISISLNQTGNDVVIKVTDTGIGIPDNEFENVFNRFYQVERSRSGKNRGTGLGLQICKRIIEAHNGKIEISKSLPGGTVVTVSLPRV